MLRKIALVLILLVFPVVIFASSIVWADEYVLVMSKDDNVCQHMLGLYNEDLRKYGEVKFDEHEEFNRIKWEEKKYYTTFPDGKKHYPVYPYDLKTNVLMTRFDINNDGKEEVVIKDTNSLSGRPSESLYYFKNEDSHYFNDEEVDVNIAYNKATGAVGTGGFKSNVYRLKELPQISEIIGGKEEKLFYVMGGWFYVKPFVFNDAYYIDVRDDDPSDIKKFLVVLRYTSGNQLKDICYYLKAPDCKTKTQRRK